MSLSDDAPLVLHCGACPKVIRLDPVGDLVHADGTPLCLAEERVFPSLESLQVVREVEPQVAYPDLPQWAELDREARRPRGFGVALLVFAMLGLAVWSFLYAWFQLP